MSERFKPYQEPEHIQETEIKNKPTVFIVEDDKEKRDLIQGAMESILSQDEIQIATSGEEGYTLITTHLAEKDSAAYTLIAMDGSFKHKPDDKDTDMNAGVTLTRNIIAFCKQDETASIPMPYFMGTSSLRSNNVHLEALLTEHDLADHYVGNLLQDLDGTLSKLETLFP